MSQEAGITHALEGCVIQHLWSYFTQPILHLLTESIKTRQEHKDAPVRRLRRDVPRRPEGARPPPLRPHLRQAGAGRPHADLLRLRGRVRLEGGGRATPGGQRQQMQERPQGGLPVRHLQGQGGG